MRITLCTNNAVIDETAELCSKLAKKFDPNSLDVVVVIQPSNQPQEIVVEIPEELFNEKLVNQNKVTELSMNDDGEPLKLSIDGK